MTNFIIFLVYVVTSIRSRVVNELRKQGTLDEVEKLYNIDYEAGIQNISVPQLPPSKTKETSATNSSDSDETETRIIDLCQLLVDKHGPHSLANLLPRICALLPSHEILNGADRLFASIAEFHGIRSNPSKFVSLSLEAMKKLQSAGKENLLLKFAQCTGVMRPDGSDTLMAIGRMPFGLLEHQIKFFACTNTQQVVNIIQLVVSFLSVKIKLIVNLLMICACFCHRVK